MENKELVQEAFFAWAALVRAMGKERPAELIQHTFAIVVQKWHQFDNSTQLVAQKTILSMVQDHGSEIPDYAAMIPSLDGIELLEKVERELSSVKSNIPLDRYVEAFALRCKYDSVIVVRQGLQELVGFLSEHQSDIHESGNDQEMLSAVSDLYRSLLDASIRYKESDKEVVDLCAQNLGILGCVDPNRLESVRAKHQMLVLSNFEHATEVVDFVAHLLENVLVEAFRSAATGTQQNYLAYVMQELLRISGMKDAVLQRSRESPANAPLVRWKRFPASTQSVLSPFLNSKYQLNNPIAPPTELQPFPDTGPAPDHATWLRRFVFVFLHRSKGQNTKEIFPITSRVIMWHDLSIAAFMIPYVVQNIVVEGTELEIAFIKSEIQAIIEFDIENLDESDVSNIKQCSEVCTQNP
jgi:serine/threonine-protein kinase ATR